MLPYTLACPAARTLSLRRDTRVRCSPIKHDVILTKDRDAFMAVRRVSMSSSSLSVRVGVVNAIASESTS